MAKRNQTPNTLGEQIAQQILSHYDLKDAQVVQNVMKQISNITDCVLEAVDRWRTRPLKPFYPFAFVDSRK
jgi:transposase-like protein